MRRSVTLFACLVLAGLYACAPATPSTVTHNTLTPDMTRPPVPPDPTSAVIEGTPDAPLNLQGTFVYAAGDGSLWLQDAQGGDPVPLVERSTESIAQLPAVSPDGEQVAYSALLFLADGSLRGDVRGIDMGGKEPRTLVKADANDVVYLYPRFARDGRLLVTRTEGLQTTGERAWLEWVNLNGKGERIRIVGDARDADVSPDGARIAFVRYDVATMRSGLWLAEADGANARQLVDDSTFTAVMSPRFSPDGTQLAFSVHGTPQKSLPRMTGQSSRQLAGSAEDSCIVRLWFTCLLDSAAAHNAPGALWSIHLETGKFRPLTDVYDDTPVPAWTADSSRIAIHDYTGIRLIDPARQIIYPLFLEDGGSGGFDWSKK